jgi:predicted nucleic acid-binding protein
MILVDTSVWVAHLRYGTIGLASLLNDAQVIGHPFVVGELACGNLKKRTSILSLLKALPMADVATHEEVLNVIERYSLMGKGLGYIDAHLIASALLSKVPLWTLDKKLERIAALMRISYRVK